MGTRLELARFFQQVGKGLGEWLRALLSGEPSRPDRKVVILTFGKTPTNGHGPSGNGKTVASPASVVHLWQEHHLGRVWHAGFEMEDDPAGAQGDSRAA